MRLTVHVKDAKKKTVEVRSKQKPGTTFMREVTINTLSFLVKDQNEVNMILSELENGERGIPVKHHLSEETIYGLAKVKKKK